MTEQAQAEDWRAQIQASEDFAWAHGRVTSMCASALVDAQLHGKKLLKGFGYPNEAFSRAQDYRALNAVLAELSRLSRVEQALREALKDAGEVFANFAVWPPDDTQGVRFHATEAMRRVVVALSASLSSEPKEQ